MKQYAHGCRQLNTSMKHGNTSKISENLIKQCDHLYKSGKYLTALKFAEVINENAMDILTQAEQETLGMIHEDCTLEYSISSSSGNNGLNESLIHKSLDQGLPENNGMLAKLCALLFTHYPQVQSIFTRIKALLSSASDSKKRGQFVDLFYRLFIVNQKLEKAGFTLQNASETLFAQPNLIDELSDYANYLCSDAFTSMDTVVSFCLNLGIPSIVFELLS